MRIATPESSPKSSMTRIAELVDVQLAGVDHHVGPVPQGLEEAALVADGFFHLVAGDGVAPPGPLEPPHEDVLGGVEVDDPDPVALGLQRVDGGERLLRAGPRRPGR